MNVNRTHLAYGLGLVVVLLILAGCSGCSSINRIDLPDISADSITYKRTDPVGGSVVEAKNLVDHGTHVTADRVKVTTIYPTVTLTIDVENYKRVKPAPAPAAPADVSANGTR